MDGWPPDRSACSATRAAHARAVVTTFDKELRTLVKDLVDTMLDAPGVGLAAPQIGVGLRVFVYDVDDALGHLVNPVLHFPSDEEQDGPRAACRCPTSPSTACASSTSSRTARTSTATR
jgi:hypothetical protein